MFKKTVVLALSATLGVLSMAINPVYSQGLTWLGVYNCEYGGTSGDSIAYGVSLDGSVVVGKSFNFSCDIRTAFRWTRSDGMTTPLYPESSYASAVTPDGSVMVGAESYFTSYAFVWTQSTGKQILPELGGMNSAALAISPEGSVIVGWSAPTNQGRRAVQWVGGNIIALGTLGRDMEVATGVSANGNVIVGWTRADASENFRYRAFRWTPSTGMQDLDLSALGDGDSQALAVSADGTVIVGYVRVGGEYRAFRWTQDTGAQDIGEGIAYAVSADGSVIVGGESPYGAFLWTEANGREELNTVYAHLLGDSSQLDAAHAVSADGRYVAGVGQRDNFGVENEAFVLDLFARCGAHNGDVDQNGCVDDADLLAVLFAFGSTGSNLGRVDINCDEQVDDADLLIVLFNFGDGC